MSTRLPAFGQKRATRGSSSPAWVVCFIALLLPVALGSAPLPGTSPGTDASSTFVAAAGVPCGPLSDSESERQARPDGPEERDLLGGRKRRSTADPSREAAPHVRPAEPADGALVASRYQLFCSYRL